MALHSPKQLSPAAAARVLETSLAGKGTEFTIADAAARSGLPLRDAQVGLHALVGEFRGHLRVTADGDLLFRFPQGFTKPWETRDRLDELGRRIAKGALGVARFVVRAWISIVLVAYALIFLALIIGLAFARDSRDDRGFGFEIAWIFLRIVADALFWTFHPFSPFAYVDYGSAGRGRKKRKKDETPFYEKVNRFFFGPTVPDPDPRAVERRLLAEIRAQKGRIGLADVIRVTGLPREEADPLMSRLLLDYEGDVEVSEQGGIVYRFEGLRKTAEEAEEMHRPRPIWERIQRLVPLTGNTLGSNLLIGGLNLFNLIMSGFALANGLTFAKIAWLYEMSKLPPVLRDPSTAPTGTAIALGVVPLVFSIALFALPVVRAALRPRKERRIARENGRRAMLREILENLGTGEVTDEALREAWKKASGREPDEKEITREVVALGGDVDYESGKVRYRFPDFEAEAKALAAEREAAAESEAKVGEVVFSSET